MLTNVGSPPIVSRTSSATSRASTSSPSASTRAQASSVYGSVTRGSSCTRVTTLEKSNETSAGSIRPVMGAAEAGSGVAESGMWPSPANSAEVGSSPIHPAPGT